MIFESVFMIRGGSFGEDFGIKLVLGVGALIASIYDWRKNKRFDYLWVYLFATMIWAGAELIIQLKQEWALELWVEAYTKPSLHQILQHDLLLL